MTADDVLRVTRLRRLAKTGEAQRIREASGASLRMFGDALGVATATVHRWETGERTPRPDLALAYLDLLDALQAQAGELVPA